MPAGLRQHAAFCRRGPYAQPGFMKSVCRTTKPSIATATSDYSPPGLRLTYSPPGRTFFGVAYAMRAQFGDAALPSLRTVMEKAPSPAVRVRCVEETRLRK
jgi:hypothetical protein